MLDNIQDTGILLQMKKQHQAYCVQRDQVQVNFQQLVGAIFALETMITAHEEELKKQVQEMSNKSQGVNEDVQVSSEKQEQVA